jgi:hypothetical protein
MAMYGQLILPALNLDIQILCLPGTIIRDIGYPKSTRWWNSAILAVIFAQGEFPCVGVHRRQWLSRVYWHVNSHPSIPTTTHGMYQYRGYINSVYSGGLQNQVRAQHAITICGGQWTPQKDGNLHRLTTHAQSNLKSTHGLQSILHPWLY